MVFFLWVLKVRGGRLIPVTSCHKENVFTREGAKAAHCQVRVNASVIQCQCSLTQAAHTGQGSRFPLIRQTSPIIYSHHAHLRGQGELLSWIRVQKFADQLIKHILYTQEYTHVP